MKAHLSMFLVAVMFLFAACKPEVTPPPEVPEDPDFVLNVDGITQSECHFTVTPKDKDMPYVVQLLTAEDMALIADDEALIDEDLEYFDLMAEMQKVTLSEWLEEYLYVGDLDATEKRLSPATDYVLYVYGLSYDADVLTKVAKITFSTKAVQRADVKFALEVTEKTKTSITVKATPTPESATYFLNIIDQAAYEQFGGDQTAFANQVEFLVNYYLDKGATREDIFKNLSSIGTADYTRDELFPGQTYYAFAIGIDEKFHVNTEPEFVKVETVPVEPSDNEITVDLDQISYNGFSALINTTNEDPYIWSVQPKEQCEMFASDEEIMWEVAGIYRNNNALEEHILKGANYISDIDYLKPATDYYLLVFGWDDAPTTSLVKIPVHTLAANGKPEDLEVEFTIDELTHNSVTVTSLGSSDVYYFSDIIEYDYYQEMLEAKGSVDAAVRALADESIEYGADFMYITPVEYLAEVGIIGRQKYTYTALNPETSYIVYAISVNMETGVANSTKGFVTEEIITKERVVSDASLTFTQGHYYDGDALAEADFTKYGKLKGMALLTYTVEPNATAGHWYTNFMEGDNTMLDDDMVADLLVTYGYEMGNPDNVQFDSRSGAYVMPYDEVYSFMGIAKDANDTFGHAVIVPVTLTKDGASPVDEFLNAQQSPVIRVPAKVTTRRRAPRQGRILEAEAPALRPASSASLPYAINAPAAPMSVKMTTIR